MLTEPRHRLYSIALTHPFTISDGQNAVQNVSKPDGNIGTDFKNGFMLANDYQFIVYGGYMDLLDKDPAVGQSWALARYLFQNGNTPLEKPTWKTLGLSGVTRYIAGGGSVNVPSENKAFVFSGATVSRSLRWSFFFFRDSPHHFFLFPSLAISCFFFLFSFFHVGCYIWRRWVVIVMLDSVFVQSAGLLIRRKCHVGRELGRILHHSDGSRPGSNMEQYKPDIRRHDDNVQ